MRKELKCYSCGKTFNKYDADYSEGDACCPYCRSDNVDANTSDDDNNTSNDDKKKKKHSFGLFD